MAKNAREQTAVTKVEPSPSYLAQFADGDTSLDALRQHRLVSRIKIVQGLSPDSFKDAVGEGGFVLIPGGSPIGKRSSFFIFNPLLYFTEYCLWSDRKDESQPAVLERSFDPNSEIAKRCSDPKRRSEQYGGTADKPFIKRWVEHHVFIGVIVDCEVPDAQGQVVALSFEKGEHMKGQTFINACINRKASVEVDGETRRISIPLWAQQWAFKSAKRERKGNAWWGFEFSIPDDRGVIPEELAEERRTASQELRDLQKQRLIEVDRTEREVEPEVESTDGM